MLSGEGAAGGRSKEGRNARWPARYTAKRPLDGARCLFVSLEGSSVGHQVPVIVHKLTSPGKFLLDSSRRCVPLPYKDNIPWPCVSIIFRSRFFHSLAERAKMPNGSLFHGFRGSLSFSRFPSLGSISPISRIRPTYILENRLRDSDLRFFFFLISRGIPRASRIHLERIFIIIIIIFFSF